MQGRDKDCILVSCVRSNAERSAGRLLADWRRINVAITRARHKLVLIGSASTLGSVPLFRHLLDTVKQRGWYLQLPAGALIQSIQAAGLSFEPGCAPASSRRHVVANNHAGQAHIIVEAR